MAALVVLRPAALPAIPGSQDQFDAVIPFATLHYIHVRSPRFPGRFSLPPPPIHPPLTFNRSPCPFNSRSPPLPSILPPSYTLQTVLKLKAPNRRDLLTIGLGTRDGRSSPRKVIIACKNTAFAIDALRTAHARPSLQASTDVHKEHRPFHGREGPGVHDRPSRWIRDSDVHAQGPKTSATTSVSATTLALNSGPPHLPLTSTSTTMAHTRTNVLDDGNGGLRFTDSTSISPTRRRDAQALDGGCGGCAKQQDRVPVRVRGWSLRRVHPTDDLSKPQDMDDDGQRTRHRGHPHLPTLPKSSNLCAVPSRSSRRLTHEPPSSPHAGTRRRRRWFNAPASEVVVHDLRASESANRCACRQPTTPTGERRRRREDEGGVAREDRRCVVGATGQRDSP